MAEIYFLAEIRKLYLKTGSHIWEIPVLRRFSFSQATNTSEITLNEMQRLREAVVEVDRMFN